MLKLSRNATDPLNAYFRVDLIDDRNGIWKKPDSNYLNIFTYHYRHYYLLLLLLVGLFAALSILLVVVPRNSRTCTSNRIVP